MKGNTNRLLGPLAAALAAWAMLPGRAACGAIEGRELLVTLPLPAQTTAESMRQAAEAQILQAAPLGVDALAVAVQTLNTDAAASIGQLAGLATKRRIKLWIALQVPSNAAPDVAQAAGSLPVEGLVLLFAPPAGEATDPAQRASLLAIKRRGDELGQRIRQLRRQLGSRKRLALCTAMSEITPETARTQYVPVAELVRDGTVDVVALAGAERANLHRLRLLRDAPLGGGVFLDGRLCEENRRVDTLRRTALDAVQNETCQLLWLDGFPLETVSAIASTVQSWRNGQRRRAALEAAVAKGELTLDQEVSDKDARDVATLHGVAQGFVPSRDGRCPLVQIYAAIRGAHALLPPPIHVELRGDEGGKPGSNVLAQADIPAAEFGLEPTYRWGAAELVPAPRLKKGQTYWIYLTNTSHPDGNYVWRLARDAAGPRGHAWSTHYDYTKHSWVFRVYLAPEPSP